MTKKTLIAGAFATVLALGAAACGGGSGTATTAEAPSGTTGGTIVAAGSSFVYPLVTQWMKDYEQRSGTTVTYGPIGSGGGIAAITGRTIDLGASDAPLTPDQQAACGDCVQIPWALAGTSVAYNVPGAPEHLKLDGATIAGIFLGEIQHWNDARIAKLNPGTTLPDLRITPVFRSDSSGTTYNFTDYVQSVSPQWKRKIGRATQVSFPAGIGAKGSSGVSGLVARTKGAITYVDAAYAIESRLAYAQVENRAGAFTLPTTDAVAAAAAAVRRIPDDLAVSLVDPPAAAPDAYPISTFTYAVVHTGSAKAAALREFLTYAVTTGQQFGPDLRFAPLPERVVAADRAALAGLGT